MGQQKTPISFRIISHQKGNTQQQELNHEILSNISYVGITKEDFYNENFILNVYLLVTKNLNPFSVDRKLNDQNKHKMTYMLWKEYMPQKFYNNICKENNFLYLNGKNVLQPRVSEITTECLKEGDENYIELRNNLSQYKTIFNTSTRMYSLKFTVPLKGDVPTSKVPFIIFKTTKTRKN